MVCTDFNYSASKCLVTKNLADGNSKYLDKTSMLKKVHKTL